MCSFSLSAFVHQIFRKQLVTLVAGTFKAFLLFIFLSVAKIFTSHAVILGKYCLNKLNLVFVNLPFSKVIFTHLVVAGDYSRRSVIITNRTGS